MFILCDKFIQKNKSKPHRKVFGKYTFSCFEEIDAVPENQWTEAVNEKNLFLCYQYLKVIHQQKSDSFRFRYVIVYNRQKPIGVLYFQINDFSASLFGELVSKQIAEIKSKRASVFQRYIDQNEDETIMRLVTCGNNFVSGEHGFYLDVNSKKTTFEILESIINCVSREEKLRGKLSAVLVKDFYQEGFGDKDCWYCTRFVDFNVEPNMIVDLPKQMATLTDYLNCFSKKYRNRAKQIFKASQSLVKKRLTPTEIITYNDALYALYLQVYNQADFKLDRLKENYFANIAEHFSTHFYMDAWFKDDEIVSFASGFYLPTEIEAHYIGFDYTQNKEFELYQTILYSYIEEAIALRKASINLGRTASEIKSTVGAKAHDLMCYIKPQNTVSKLIMKPFMQFLQPSEWVPRNPFKEGE